MKDYHAFEVGEREAAEERYQDELDRRDRHMPVGWPDLPDHEEVAYPDQTEVQDE